MPRVIAAVALLAFTIYCVVDAVQTEDEEVRGLPKLVWLLMILLFPLVGGAAWLGWLVWRSRRRTRARGLPAVQQDRTPRSQRVRRKKQ